MRPSGDSSSSLTPGRLREALETLGAQLARDGTVAHLYVVGGSCLLLRGTTTRATRDVDVVALALGGGDVPDFAGADELPVELLGPAHDVARALGLADDWINPGPASLFHALPEGWPARAEARSFGGVVLHLAGRIDLVYFKLHAAADQHPAGGKHLQDLRALRPTRGELLAAAAWTRAQDPPDGFRSLLVATLESLDITDASDVLD